MRRGGRLRNQEGDGVGEEAFLSEVLPGTRLCVWYPDDDVWHTRLVLWPDKQAGRGFFKIVTPDFDEYSENVLGTDPEWCTRAMILGPGRRPRDVAGHLYSLRDVVSEAWLSQHVLRVKTAVELEGHLSDINQCVKWDYTRGDLPDLLRREVASGREHQEGRRMAETPEGMVWIAMEDGI
eukprot:6188181-Amphidinium_carterae.2